MAYTPTKAKSTGASGKYNTYGASKSAAKRKAAIDKARAETNRDNTEVNINPDNVVKSDVKGISQVAIKGTAGENVQVTEKPSVTIAIDKPAVDQYNQAAKEQGVGTAKEYFQAVRAQEAQSQPLEARRQAYTPRAPPRVPNLQETYNPNASREQKYTPYSNVPYSIQDTPGFEEIKPKLPWYSTFEGQINKVEELKVNSIKYVDAQDPEKRTAIDQAIPFAASFGAGVLKGSVSTAQEATELFRSVFVTGETKIYEVPEKVIGGTLGGTGEFLGQVVENIKSKNVKGLLEQAGEFYAYKKIGDIGKSVIVDPAVDVIESRPGTPTAKFRESVTNPQTVPLDNPVLEPDIIRRGFYSDELRPAFGPEAVPENAPEFYFTRLEKFEDLKNPKLAEVKINDEQTFSNIRAATRNPDLGGVKGVQSPRRLLDIEPQVSEAVSTLSKKGYNPVGSGFLSPDSAPDGITLPQYILIRNKLTPEIIEKIEAKGGKVSSQKGDTQITIEQKGYSLKETSERFNSIVQVIPINPKTPFKEYYLIPPEYTELAKGTGKEPIDASLGENLPGQYLAGAQGFPLVDDLKKAPELQTRLSAKQPETRTSFTAQDVIEQNLKPQTIQKQLIDFKVPPKPTGAPPTKGGKLYMSTPELAVIQTIIEESPAILEKYKNKYQTYKENVRSISSDIITKEGGNSRTPPIIIRIEKDISVRDSPIISSVGFTNKPGVKSLPEADIASRPISDTRTSPGSITRSQPEIDQRANSAQEISQTPISSQAQTSELITGQEIIQQQRQTTRQIQDPELQRKVPFVPVLPREDKKKSEGNFEIEVRKKGIFTKTGRASDSLIEAEREARNILETTEAASYRILRNGEVQDVNPGPGFARSKRNSKVIIEPVSNRINTPGEKKEITYKGNIFSRGKAKKAFVF